MLNYHPSDIKRNMEMEVADQGRSKVVAAFGRKPLNFRIPNDLAATLEQPWSRIRIFRRARGRAGA